MSEYLTNGAALTHTADRIRAKTGETAQIVWDAEKGFGNAVDAISGSEKIQHADIPDYVKAEALAVAEGRMVCPECEIEAEEILDTFIEEV